MADHAQWEIKLGDDATMTSIRASFTGQELKITGELALAKKALRWQTLLWQKLIPQFNGQPDFTLRPSL